MGFSAIQVTKHAIDITFAPIGIRRNIIVHPELYSILTCKSAILKAITNVEMELQSLQLLVQQGK